MLLGKYTAESRHPAPSVFPRLLKRFDSGSESIKAAAHSALTELLILMGKADPAAWSNFKLLLSTEFLKQIPLPPDFMTKLSADPRVFAAAGRTTRVREEILYRYWNPFPDFLCRVSNWRLEPVFAGRIYDLYRKSEQGTEILDSLNKEEKQHFKRSAQASGDNSLLVSSFPDRFLKNHQHHISPAQWLDDSVHDLLYRGRSITGTQTAPGACLLMGQGLCFRPELSVFFWKRETDDPQSPNASEKRKGGPEIPNSSV